MGILAMLQNHDSIALIPLPDFGMVLCIAPEKGAAGEWSVTIAVYSSWLISSELFLGRVIGLMFFVDLVDAFGRFAMLL
jgi:hypothetical protein